MSQKDQSYDSPDDGPQIPQIGDRQVEEEDEALGVSTIAMDNGNPVAGRPPPIHLDGSSTGKKTVGFSDEEPLSPQEREWGYRQLAPCGETERFDMTPVIKNRTIADLSSSLKGGICVVVLTVIGTFLQLGVFDSDDWLTIVLFVLGVCINGLALLIVVSSYSRSHLLDTIKSFDFIYLSTQILIFNTVDAIEKSVTLPHWGWVLFLIPNSLLTCIALLGMDASHWPRKLKGGIMVFAGFVYLALAATMFFGKTTANNKVTVGIFETNLGTIAQTCALNLGLFGFKFGFTALALGKEVILTRYYAEKEDHLSQEEVKRRESMVLNENPKNSAQWSRHKVHMASLLQMSTDTQNGLKWFYRWALFANRRKLTKTPNSSSLQ